MYGPQMQTNMGNLNRYMRQFNISLKKVQAGSTSLEQVEGDIERVLSNIQQVYRSIESQKPDYELERIHQILLEAANCYEQGISEFLKFYDDGNDDHMVAGGMLIMEGNDLMNKAARMF